MTETKTMKNKDKAWWILFLMSLYVLSPIDFFPDVAPFVGNIDDLVVMLFSAQKAFPMLEEATSVAS
ncbi:MAG: DUF1232 domain-containing protein [Planctomycetaceae bacterium]|nr:DUF1232 domain-containing protein [Planctomycetaceae bacterium]